MIGSLPSDRVFGTDTPRRHLSSSNATALARQPGPCAFAVNASSTHAARAHSCQIGRDLVFARARETKKRNGHVEPEEDQERSSSAPRTLSALCGDARAV